LGGFLLLTLVGCASKSTPSTPAPLAEDPCLLVTQSAERLDTFTIALPDPVDLTHAFQPINDSERLLFRNLLPNLVRLDCEGALRPGILESWTVESNGVWIFTLHDQARFGSGHPMSVIHVAGTLAPAAGTKVPGIDSAVVLNDRQIRVFSLHNQDSVLRLLADPAFALLDGLAARRSSSAEGSIDLPARGNLPMLELRFPLQGDGRDALDRGADLIVSRDPTLVEYAANRQEFTTFPLPWSRTYVLLQPLSAEPLIVTDLDLERRSLARDAVEADARGAEPPFWWNDAAACPAAVSPGAPATAARIAYVRGDEVARSLAERLVALVETGTQLRTVGLDQSQFAAALREGAERAYVVALPRQTLSPCRETAQLPRNARIEPLIDSRAHAIVRKGAPPLSVEWDGTIRVVDP
jgi:hypothetical protein